MTEVKLVSQYHRHVRKATEIGREKLYISAAKTCACIYSSY